MQSKKIQGKLGIWWRILEWRIIQVYCECVFGKKLKIMSLKFSIFPENTTNENFQGAAPIYPSIMYHYTIAYISELTVENRIE